jgi:hypothetical protein
MSTIAHQRIPQPHGGVLQMWPKGVSGNPRGRPNAGAAYREWLNQMEGWTEAEIRAVADDPDEPASKRQAARSHLRALEEGRYHAVPLAANDLDRICDRTDGKPTQRLEVARVERDPDQIQADLAALLAANPELVEDIAAMPPVDLRALPVADL